LITQVIFGEAYKHLIMQSFQASTLFPSGSNILLGTLFSNTLSICSSLSVRDQVLLPHKTTDKIVVFTEEMERQWTKFNLVLVSL
jgi:hypothetical protein